MKIQHKFYGNYVGMVVQNNDPKQRGRVKVYIPHLCATVYAQWNQETDEKNIDFKSFKSLANEGKAFDNILSKVKDILPWAECASPIVGETGKGHYNASTKENEERDRPSQEQEDSPQTDAFGNQYNDVKSYNNQTTGSFSIPKVGSRVWCFFEDGDTLRPVYFATAFSRIDWEGYNTYEGDYPKNFENNKQESDKYKNKWVLNQKGGVIEVVNTDENESLFIGHHSGSYKVWTNSETKELVVGNKNELILKNKTEHVKGNSFITIDGSLTINSGSVQHNVSGSYDLEVSGPVTIKGSRIDLNP